MRFPRHPGFLSAAAVLGLVLAAGVVRAGEGATLAVQFVDGRTLEVSAIRREGDGARLTLIGGGELQVPVARIVNWDGIAESRVRIEHQRQQDEVRRRWEAQQGWRRAAGSFADVIQSAAQEHDLDPALLTAMAEVESAFDPSALSPKGAQGLLQLIPQTAERFGVRDPFDPRQNVAGAARYLRWLLDRFEGDVELALAGYNAGEAAVERYSGIPPYRETQRYVVKVLDGVGRLGRPVGIDVAGLAGAP